MYSMYFEMYTKTILAYFSNFLMLKLIIKVFVSVWVKTLTLILIVFHIIHKPHPRIVIYFYLLGLCGFR